MLRRCSVLVAILAGALCAPLDAQPTGHLLQRPGEHVVLVPTTTGIASCTFRRVLPEGIRETVDFQVPAGRLLVITDLEWEVAWWFVFGSPNQPLLAGQTVVAELVLGGGGRSPATPVLQSRSVTVPADGAAVAGSEHASAGVTVAPAAQLCLRGHTRRGATVDPVVFTQAVLRGYLIDAS